MKKIVKSILALSLLTVISTNAQSGDVGIGTTTPNASAALDVTSTTKGLLMPRMTSTQRAAVATPAAGLQVYDTTTNTIWYHNGTAWVNNGSATFVSKWTNDASNTRVALTNLSNGTTARTAGTEMVVTDAGNVGIGTATPTQKLEVNGSTITNGSFYFNGVTDTGNDGARNFYFGNTRYFDVLSLLNGTGTNDAFNWRGNNTNAGTSLMRLRYNGQLVLPSYGIGTNTGTVTNFLGVDANGNVVESNLSSGTAPNIYNVDGVINSGQNRNINMNGGTLNFQGTAGKFTFNNTGNTFTTNATNLVLEQTGDYYGTTSLFLENRSGSAGVRIKQGNTSGLDVVDLRLETLISTSNIRSEGRTTNFFSPSAVSGNSELQLGLAGNPSFVVGDDYTIFRNTTAYKGIYIDGMTDLSQNGSRIVNANTAMFFDRRMATATLTDAAFKFRADTTTGSAQLMTLNYNGNLGVGTATPDEKLEINGSIKLSSNYKLGIKNYSDLGIARFGLNMPTVFGEGDTAYQGSFISFDARAGQNALSFWVKTASSPIEKEAMSISSTGNVGIGSIAPTSKLQVVGLTIHVDNTAAITAGLTAGAFYHNGDGVVRVVF